MYEEYTILGVYYKFYTSHNILSSHYSSQSFELCNVRLTSDNARHLSHYISTASQLKELVLRSVWDRDAREYVHN